MTTKTYGSRYDCALSVKEIAQKVRVEMRADPALRGVKVSVRYDSFSGGSAIRVSVVAVPAGMKLLTASEERLRAGDNLTPEARALLDGITERFAAFNFDGSDSQSDYFDVNFYDGRASFEGDLLDAARASLTAAPVAPVETGPGVRYMTTRVVTVETPRLSADALRERVAQVEFARAREAESIRLNLASSDALREVEAAKAALLAASRVLAAAEAKLAEANRVLAEFKNEQATLDKRVG